MTALERSALERAVAAPEPVHGFTGRSPLHGLERRSVGSWDVLAQSVAAVAPAAAATTVVVLVAGVSPAATVLSILVAGALSLMVAWTISLFARRIAAAGSTYTYTARGLGVRAGLASAAALVTGYAAVAVFSLLGGAYYLTLLSAPLLAGWEPGASGQTAAPLSGVLVVEVVVVALVLIRGIRLSARVALVVEGLSVALIVTLLVILLTRIGPLDPATLLLGEGVTPAAVAAGSVIALTAFVGFESAATLGVEAASPLRAVPRAISTTVLVSAGVYVLAAVAQVGGFAALGVDLADSGSPVNDLAAAYGLGDWSALADVGIAASFLACAIGSTTALTRVLFALSRDGVVSSFAGRTHRRFGTPTGALLLCLPPIAATPVLLVAAGVGVRDAMHLIIAVGGAGFIVAYILVCVAAPVFLRRIGESTAWSAAVAVISAAGLAAALVGFLAVDTATGSPAVYVCTVLALVAAVAIAVRVRRGRRSLLAVGSYDEPVAADVLGGVAQEGAARDA